MCSLQLATRRCLAQLSARVSIRIGNDADVDATECDDPRFAKIDELQVMT